MSTDQYQPSVVVEPGSEARYQQVLAICRQATAAQRAQLETITGTVETAGAGASRRAVLGKFLGSAGFDSSWEEGAPLDAGVGVVSGLASAFASGAEETAAETRRILLNCWRRPRRTESSGKWWSKRAGTPPFPKGGVLRHGEHRQGAIP